jgi:protein TonB
MLAVCAFAARSAQAQMLVQADGESAQQRIARARALAAVGNLPAARSELESLSRVQTDESVREIALVLLVGVYLEQSDYSYAERLLNETFTARQAQQREAATHAYFALAGQVIHGVRAHVERYRTLGLDVTDKALPVEATSDLDRLRALIERVVAHGKQLGAEGGPALDAAALLEEAATVRARLARNSTERTQWQREVADARQRIAGPNARLNVSPMTASMPPATSTPASNTTTASSSNTAPPVNTQSAPAPTPAPSRASVPNGNTAQPAANPTPAPTQSATPRGDANHEGSASAPGRPLDVGAQLITKAKDKVAPSYPPTARSARVTGNVNVYLTVDEQGGVAEVQRASGPELLRRAAEDAARRWKFRPTIINGQPVRVSGFISFNFAL